MFESKAGRPSAAATDPQKERPADSLENVRSHYVGSARSDLLHSAWGHDLSANAHAERRIENIHRQLEREPQRREAEARRFEKFIERHADRPDKIAKMEQTIEHNRDQRMRHLGEAAGKLRINLSKGFPPAHAPAPAPKNSPSPVPAPKPAPVPLPPPPQPPTPAPQPDPKPTPVPLPPSPQPDPKPTPSPLPDSNNAPVPQPAPKPAPAPAPVPSEFDRLPVEKRAIAETFKADSYFLTLSPEVQADVLRRANDPGAGPQVVSALKSAIHLNEFQNLNIANQRQLLNVFTPVQSEWFNRESKDWQAAIVKNLGGESPMSFETSRQILEGGTFKSLTLEDKNKTLNLMFCAGNVHGFKELVDRKVGNTSALMAVDSNGGTLLDNAHKILVAKTFVDPDIAKSRGELLDSMYKIFAKPGQTNQGNRGTCGATSCEWDFISNDPGEMSRVLAGIVTAGSCELRGKGQFVTLDPGSVRKDDDFSRTMADRLIQVSFMQYAAGADDYRNSDDRIHPIGGGDLRKGMNPYKLTALTAAFYGREMFPVADTGPMRKDATLMVSQIRENLAIGNIEVSLRWAKEVDPKAPSGERDGYHAVTVTKIANGRVYYRNPHGPSSDPDGTETINGWGPNRKVENHLTGEQSMTIDEFQKRVDYLNFWKRS